MSVCMRWISGTTSSSNFRTRWLICLGALIGGLLIAGFGPAVPSAFAASTPTVDLGQSAGYAVISGASVANTDNSTVRGDIGAPTTPSGFPPGVLVGTMQVGSADATAYNDMLHGVHRSPVPDGRRRASGVGRRDADPRAVHVRGAAGLAASVNMT